MALFRFAFWLLFIFSSVIPSIPAMHDYCHGSVLSVLGTESLANNTVRLYQSNHYYEFVKDLNFRSPHGPLQPLPYGLKTFQTWTKIFQIKANHFVCDLNQLKCSVFDQNGTILANNNVPLLANNSGQIVSIVFKNSKDEPDPYMAEFDAFAFTETQVRPSPPFTLFAHFILGSGCQGQFGECVY